LVESISQHRSLIIAGTKLRLPDLALVQSGALKTAASEKAKTVITLTAFHFVEAKAARDLLMQLVPVENDLVDTLGDKLSGRVRLWASFADCLLTRLKDDLKTPISEVFGKARDDFLKFHVHNVQSLAPLDVLSRSLRSHFQNHEKLVHTSPDKTKTLHSELAELVTYAILGLGEPRELLKIEADWVYGGICFLHEVKGGRYSLSCKEPLVLDVIKSSVGVLPILRTLCSTLSLTKAILGSSDASKGTLFQHLTVAQLLLESKRKTPFQTLLHRWVGKKEGKRLGIKLPEWVKGVVDQPFGFLSATKDDKGHLVSGLVLSGDGTTILVLPNAAGAEYLAMAWGTIPLVAGCKFYSQTNTEAFADNKATTDISLLFLQRSSSDKKCVRGYEKQQQKVSVALTQQSHSMGSIRIVFNLSSTKVLQNPAPLLEVVRVGQRNDLVFTFTRTTLWHFFDGETNTATLLDSFFR
jgi:hypothetical protein